MMNMLELLQSSSRTEKVMYTESINQSMRLNDGGKQKRKGK